MKKHKEDLATKLENLDTTRLAKWLASMIGIWIVLLAGPFVIYFGQFRGPFTGNPAEWGHFGEFVGGFAGPLLSFLALIAIILTVRLQSKQIDISNIQLELSRQALSESQEELKRSITAQERTGKSLQARRGLWKCRLE